MLIAAAWGQLPPIGDIGPGAVYAILAVAAVLGAAAFVVLLELDRLVSEWRTRRRARRRGGMITIVGQLEPRPGDDEPRKCAA
jgi:hypothetical protein